LTSTPSPTSSRSAQHWTPSNNGQHTLAQLEEPRVSRQPTPSVPGGLAACLCAAPLLGGPAPDPEQHEQQLAKLEAAGEGRGGHIWADAAALQLLQHNSLPGGLNTAEIRRIRARAARYLWQQDKLLHRWHDGSFRQVSPPSERLTLVRQHQEQLGHFGQVHHVPVASLLVVAGQVSTGSTADSGLCAVRPQEGQLQSTAAAAQVPTYCRDRVQVAPRPGRALPLDKAWPCVCHGGGGGIHQVGGPGATAFAYQSAIYA
jgi:hypothetical protein